MSDELHVQSGKFTFRIPVDRQYTPEGVWVLREPGGKVRMGLSDFVQQHSGDAAFAEAKPAGTRLQAGEIFTSLETIKVSIAFATPLAGIVAECNPALETTPEVINTDPYGDGWLVLLSADENGASETLLSPEAYRQLVQRQVEGEAG